MLQKFSLLCVIVALVVAVGLLLTPTASPTVNHDFVRIDPDDYLHVNQQLGAFSAQVVEFRKLKKGDRALSLTDEPVYFVKLRLFKNEFIDLQKSHDEFIQLAVSAGEEYLKALKDRKKVTIMFSTADGKLKSIFYLGC